MTFHFLECLETFDRRWGHQVTAVTVAKFIKWFWRVNNNSINNWSPSMTAPTTLLLFATNVPLEQSHLTCKIPNLSTVRMTRNSIPVHSHQFASHLTSYSPWFPHTSPLIPQFKLHARARCALSWHPPPPLRKSSTCSTTWIALDSTFWSSWSCSAGEIRLASK